MTTSSRRLTRRRERLAPLADERGSVTLENTIIWPVLLVVIFGLFQTGLALHARAVAHGAATAAYTASRVLDGTEASGRSVADAALAAANGTITAPNVTVTRTATTVTATVRGTTSMVVPGWPGGTIAETVTGPVERYVAP